MQAEPPVTQQLVPPSPKDRGWTPFPLELAPGGAWPHGITLSVEGCALPCFFLLPRLLKRSSWHLLC